METFFTLEVTPVQSMPQAVCAAQAGAVWEVCDNFFVAPCLGLAFLIASCSFYLLQLLLLLFVSLEGEGNSNKGNRITAHPSSPLCALSWGWNIPGVGSLCFALVLTQLTVPGHLQKGWAALFAGGSRNGEGGCFSEDGVEGLAFHTWSNEPLCAPIF